VLTAYSRDSFRSTLFLSANIANRARGRTVELHWVLFHARYSRVALRPDAHSNSDLANPDCRMMADSVPILISLWSGTGTVTVLFPAFFCMTT